MRTRVRSLLLFLCALLFVGLHPAWPANAPQPANWTVFYQNYFESGNANGWAVTLQDYQAASWGIEMDGTNHVLGMDNPNIIWPAPRARAASSNPRTAGPRSPLAGLVLGDCLLPHFEIAQAQAADLEIALEVRERLAGLNRRRGKRGERVFE